MSVAHETVGVVGELEARFPDLELTVQPTADEIPTVWVPRDRARDVVAHLKSEAATTYPMLYDLTAIDERVRVHREGQPASDFTLVYHLLSLEHNRDVRLKVALQGEAPSLPTVTGVFPAAAWYEREVWDMFGVGFDGLPERPRILMPPWWQGHPLRKESAARATEIGRLVMPPERAAEWQDMLAFRPEEWGLEELANDPEIMFLNVGPHHGGTHGVVHIVVGLRDEEIVCASSTSATTTAAPRRSASARPGTPSSPTPTASTTPAASSTTSPISCRPNGSPGSRCRSAPRSSASCSPSSTA